MSISQFSQLQFNCNNSGSPGPGECPECSGPGLVILCCPAPLNPGCNLTCETPVLIKACGGVPPYSFYDDDDFLNVTQVDVDKAIVSIRKKFVQFGYRLRSTPWSGNPCNPITSNHPGALITQMSIRQANKVYDCNMVQLIGDDYNDTNMKVDSNPCCDCACFDEPPGCSGEVNLSVPFTGGGALIAFIRTDVINNGLLHNSLGLNNIITFNGSHVGPPSTNHDEFFDTGVFATIPRGLIDIYAYDSLGNFATIAL